MECKKWRAYSAWCFATLKLCLINKRNSKSVTGKAIKIGCGYGWCCNRIFKIISEVVVRPLYFGTIRGGRRNGGWTVMFQ